MHIPSFLVGSLVGGFGCLLIHRELSHRERLSKKWLLREKMEKEAMSMWNDAKTSVTQDTNTVMPVIPGSQGQDIMNKWNGGVDSIRKFFSS